MVDREPRRYTKHASGTRVHPTFARPDSLPYAKHEPDSDIKPSTFRIDKPHRTNALLRRARQEQRAIIGSEPNVKSIRSGGVSVWAGLRTILYEEQDDSLDFTFMFYDALSQIDKKVGPNISFNNRITVEGESARLLEFKVPENGEYPNPLTAEEYFDSLPDADRENLTRVIATFAELPEFTGNEYAVFAVGKSTVPSELRKEEPGDIPVRLALNTSLSDDELEQFIESFGNNLTQGTDTVVATSSRYPGEEKGIGVLKKGCRPINIFTPQDGKYNEADPYPSSIVEYETDVEEARKDLQAKPARYELNTLIPSAYRIRLV